MLELIPTLLHTLSAGIGSRRGLALENLALRHQLQVALRLNPQPRIRNADRLLWVWLYQLWPQSRRHLLLVKPETFLRWHRRGWRLYWTWKSRTRLGRPRLSAEVRELIATMSRDNPLWGTERIRGELVGRQKSIGVTQPGRRRDGGRREPIDGLRGLQGSLQGLRRALDRIKPATGPGPFFAIDDPADQLRSLLVAFYERYRATEPMTLNVQRDRLMLPALDEVAGGHGDAQMAMLATQLADGFTKRAPDKKRVRAAVALALNFWTWRRLSREGLDDQTAARLMVGAVQAAARAASS